MSNQKYSGRRLGVDYVFSARGQDLVAPAPLGHVVVGRLETALKRDARVDPHNDAHYLARNILWMESGAVWC